MSQKYSTETARTQYGRQAAQYASSASHAGGPDLARLIELLRFEGHETVLDVATGTGHTALTVEEWHDALTTAGFTIHHVEVDEEQRTLHSYFDIAGTPQADREAIAAMLRAAGPEALASFGYQPDPAPEGSFLKERIVVLASRASGVVSTNCAVD